MLWIAQDVTTCTDHSTKTEGLDRAIGWAASSYRFACGDRGVVRWSLSVPGAPALAWIGGVRDGTGGMPDGDDYFVMGTHEGLELRRYTFGGETTANVVPEGCDGNCGNENELLNWLPRATAFCNTYYCNQVRMESDVFFQIERGP